MISHTEVTNYLYIDLLGCMSSIKKYKFHCELWSSYWMKYFQRQYFHYQHQHQMNMNITLLLFLFKSKCLSLITSYYALISGASSTCENDRGLHPAHLTLKVYYILYTIQRILRHHLGCKSSSLHIRILLEMA